jgi:heat shock transcription factor 1
MVDKLPTHLQENAFLSKLWHMLVAPENYDVICWDSEGTKFEIKRPEEMSEVVLPKYFRHKKFSSFQRQLNYFGFKKVGKGELGSFYSHSLFNRDQPEDILKIRRRTNKKKSDKDSDMLSDYMSSVDSEMELSLANGGLGQNPCPQDQPEPKTLCSQH